MNEIKEELYQSMMIGDLTISSDTSKQILDYIEEKDKEIERLKKGYCELEKYFAKPNKFIERPERIKILDRIKELKEGKQ